MINAAWLVPIGLLAAYLLHRYTSSSVSRRSAPQTGRRDIGTARTGDRVRIPKGCKIVGLDEVILQLPGELLADDDVIGNVIQGHDDMGFSADMDETTGKTSAIFVRLGRGHDLTLSKSSEALVHAEDRTVRIQVVSRGSG